MFSQAPAQEPEIDYTKHPQKGGTRVHDPVVSRTLMTGIGQTVGSNRKTGSMRALDVHEKIPPECAEHCSDPGMAEIHRQGNQEVNTPIGTAAMVKSFPLRGESANASSKGHQEVKANPAATNATPGDPTSPSARDLGPRKMLRVPGAVQGGVSGATPRNSVR